MDGRKIVSLGRMSRKVQYCADRKMALPRCLHSNVDISDAANAPALVQNVLGLHDVRLVIRIVAGQVSLHTLGWRRVRTRCSKFRRLKHLAASASLSWPRNT